MNKTINLAVTVLGLSASLAAQTTAIFPPYAEGRDGQSYETYGPLSSGVTRYQIIYDKADLTIPNQASITSIGFRQDCQIRSASAGYKLQLEVKMGPSAKTSDTLASQFANNYVATDLPKTVFTKQLWDLPALPAPTATLPAPSGNKVMIPLSVPYVFQANSNLLVEYLLYATNNGNQAFPYYIDRMTHFTATTTYGSACATSTSSLPTLAGNTPPLGQWWAVTLSKAPATAPTGVLIGIDNQSWNSIPLPMSLAPFGAPGCTLHVDYLVTAPVTTNTSGSVSFGLTPPLNVAYNGAQLCAQAVSYDPFVNNLGIVTSNGVKSVFGFPARSCGVYANGNVAATTGTPFTYDGMVALFAY